MRWMEGFELCMFTKEQTAVFVSSLLNSEMQTSPNYDILSAEHMKILLKWSETELLYP